VSSFFEIAWIKVLNHRHRIKVIPISFFLQGIRINGHLHLPGLARPPVVIGSHGLFSSGNSPKQIALAARCAEAGIAFFRFDHRGCGNSGGEFQQVTTLDGRVADLAGAVKAMQEYPGVGDRMAIFGSSMGGAAGLCFASDATAHAVVTVAAPLHSEPILQAG